MSPELARRGRPLEDLAVEINVAHRECEAAFRAGLEHAIRAGALLAEAKAQLPHGEWLTWVAEHTKVSERNAQRYMQLSRARAANPTAMSGLGIEGALRVIATPRTRQAVTGASPVELGGGDAARERPPADAVPATLQEDIERSADARRRRVFPRNGMERGTMRQVAEGIESVERLIENARLPKLIDWARANALREAATKARAVADTLDELADTVYPPGVRR